MEAGHFGECEETEGAELDQISGLSEFNGKDSESERPSFEEVPRLEGADGQSGEPGLWESEGWKADDADRESAEQELPSLADAENPYYSTYEERMQQTPGEDGERGEWSGERGESDYTPNDEEVQEILDRYDQEHITYEDAIPDFSDVAEATVEIDNMTQNRADNFKQCDEKCAEQWNKEGRGGRTDWTAREVKEWRQDNGYSWHERNDMKTCDLVPTRVNEYFGHLGGVAECRKRDNQGGGNEFDE